MKISIVIPVYNSEHIQKELYTRLVKVLSECNNNYEIIFINDGSQDNSIENLKQLCLKDKNVKLIDFSRNFGHQSAITAGFEKASGDIIAVIDDDLQDPPEILPTFIDKLNEGYDVVYGIRKKRKENFLRRSFFYIFYRILGLLSRHDIPFDTGDFCVMNRKVLDNLNRFQETNKFIRGIRSWIGFRQTGIEYERDARYAGSSQYTLKKYFKFALDAILSFSYLPLRLSTLFGFLVAGVSFFYGLYIIIKKFQGLIEHVPGFTTLFVSTAFIGGVLLICLGIIGEYVARIYDEIKKRPQYIIKYEKGFE